MNTKLMLISFILIGLIVVAAAYIGVKYSRMDNLTSEDSEAIQGNNLYEKIYNAEYQEIILKDKISGEEVSKIKLDTPLVNHVMPGKDRLVAEITINNIEDAGNVFSNMELYNARTGDPLTRSLKYKYLEIKHETWTTENRICEDEEKLLNCIYTPEEFIVEKKIWHDLNTKEVLIKGNITVGLFAEVYPNDKVEWIPTFYSTRINEWAVWDSGLNNGLVRYWTLNETSGIYGNNSLESEGAFELDNNWTSGLIDNSFNVSNARHLQTQNPWATLNDSDGSMTVNFWLNKTGVWAQNGVDDRDVLGDQGPGVSAGSFGLTNLDSNIYLRPYLHDGSYKTGSSVPIPVYDGGSPWYGYNWFMVTIRFNATTMAIYINGTEMTNMGASAFVKNSAQWALFGRDPAKPLRNMQIDEFSVWNRSLSNAEIEQLFNNGAGLTYQEAQDNPPYFTGIANQSVYNNASLGYDINASDDIGLSCFTVNDTTNFQINCSGWLSNKTALNVQQYYLNITINDSSNNLNSTEMWINVSSYDLHAPYFTGIANQSVYDNVSFGYDINASDDGTGLSCFTVNDTTNFQINCSGWLSNKTALNVQQYYLNITINDSVNRLNSTEMWVNVSTSNPVLWRDHRNLTYDDFEDGSIDAGRWTNSGAVESNGWLEVYIDSTANEYFNSNSFNRSEVRDIYIRTNFRVSDTNAGANAGLRVWYNFSVFGNQIESLFKEDTPGTSNVTYTSNWTIKANGTNYDVFNDGVFQEKITPSNSVIGVNVDSDSNGAGSLQLMGRAYYVDYNGVNGNSYLILNSPDNNSMQAANPISFSCSAIVAGYSTLSNISLWHNQTGTWAINQTNTTVYEGTNTSIFYSNFSDGEYSWTCTACAANGLCGASLDNRTFQLSTNFPSFTDIGNLTILKNQSVSYDINATDDLAVDCFTVNDTTNFQINCSGWLQNITSLNVSTYYLNVSVNNTINNRIYEIIFIDVVGSNITGEYYSNETFEGNTEFFSINITAFSGLALENAYLIYNGSSYSGTIIDYGGGVYEARRNLIIPDVSAILNYSFYWNINFDDGSAKNSTLHNQTVSNLSVENCTTFSYKLLNISHLDEELQTAIDNGTIEVAVNITTYDKSEKIIEFAIKYEDENPVSICSDVNLSEESYFMSALIKYYAPGYATEYYTIETYSLSNHNVILYDLNSSDSTDFKLTFTGTDFLPEEDVLVFVERQYVSEGNFKTVELPKTDSNGQTILHLVRNDVYYNMRFVKDGNILRTFYNLRAFCDDFSIGDCKISLNALSSEGDLYNYTEELGIVFSNAPVYDEDTNIISFSFSSYDGVNKNITMIIERNDIFGNVSICRNSLTSASGTVSCNVGSDITDAVLKATIEVDETPLIITSVAIDKTAYGSFGYIAWFFLALGLMMMFSKDKNGILFAIILSYAGAVSLGWIVGGIVGVGSAGIWIIIITLIGLYRLNKNKFN